MNRLTQIKFSALCLLMGTFTGAAHASTCGAESIAFSSMGEHYFEVDTDTSAAEINALYLPSRKQLSSHSKRILASLTKRKFRGGSGTRYKCVGNKGHGKVIQTGFDLEDIEQAPLLNGVVLLKAWEDSRRKRASATIDLAAEHDWAQDAASFELVNTQRVRRRSNQFSFDLPVNFLQHPFNESSDPFSITGGCALRAEDAETNSTRLGDTRVCRSYFAEIETRVRDQGKHTYITQAIYINGRKVEWVKWQLDS